ncbi:ABC transporter permease (plasmid) [Rhizobium sp. TH2]|uniref:ABC transporter permease n=1 Tax=Rhizobium sp. TH2 TaxID=2775403 RepID=UPI0021571A0F|nr:ABC transporter permease [Rhizobium sp. TH2]UVC12675.1 ABC transporter permease [Rhizobium sp. TH2]
MNAQKLKPYFPVLTLLALVVLVGGMDPSFLRPANLLIVAADVSALFVMALGLTFVIYIGSIDLSTQSVASMTTVLVTIWLNSFGIGAAVIALAIGAGFGVLSGYASIKTKIPTFIATLAVGGIAYSVARFASGEKGVSMIETERSYYLGWLFGYSGPIPNEIICAGVLLLVALFIERRTVFGRVLKAVGAAEHAAIASGVRVERYKIAAFAICGLLAAFSGLMLSARLSGGSSLAANQFLLPAIVAVLVGGTPLTGGVGGVLNTLIGALIVAVIRTSMVFLNIPADAQQIFFGVVLIIAIALTLDRSKVLTVK